jgi:hypothetical protein
MLWLNSKKQPQVQPNFVCGVHVHDVLGALEAGMASSEVKLWDQFD